MGTQSVCAHKPSLNINQYGLCSLHRQGFLWIAAHTLAPVKTPPFPPIWGCERFRMVNSNKVSLGSLTAVVVRGPRGHSKMSCWDQNCPTVLRNHLHACHSYITSKYMIQCFLIVSLKVCLLCTQHQEGLLVTLGSDKEPERLCGCKCLLQLLLHIWARRRGRLGSVSVSQN